jgi:hypothetical protein
MALLDVTLDEIEYFNERPYHNDMDIDCGDYAESCGWQLGDVPEVRVRHAWNWQIAEHDPRVVVYHPLSLEGVREHEPDGFSAATTRSSGTIL